MGTIDAISLYPAWQRGSIQHPVWQLLRYQSIRLVTSGRTMVVGNNEPGDDDQHYSGGGGA